jgi:hypothetical protein
MIKRVVLLVLCALGVSSCFYIHDLEPPSPERVVKERFAATVDSHPLLRGTLDAASVRVISGPASQRGDFMEGNVIGWHKWCMTLQLPDTKARERVIRSLFTLSFQQKPIRQSEQQNQLMSKYFDEWKSTEVLLIQASERFEKEQPNQGLWHFDWDASTNICN